MSPEAFLAFADTLPHPACLLTDGGEVVAANRAAQRQYGLASGGCRRLSDMVTDDDAKVADLLRIWSRSRDPLPGALRIRSADGSEIQSHCKGALVRPAGDGRPALLIMHSLSRQQANKGFAALNEKINALRQEIAERKQVERALRESEAQVRLLLESTAEAIFGVDTEGTCMLANPACALMLGYDSPEELMGKDMPALLRCSTPGDTSDPRLFLKRLIHDQAAHSADACFTRHDGRELPVEFWAHPLRRDGPLLGAVVTFIDISERKAAQEEILRLNRNLERRVEERTQELKAVNETLMVSLEQLRQAQDQLIQAEKMAALGGLVAGVAHEINTPVGTAVTAASHLDASVSKYRQRYESNRLQRADFEAFLNTVVDGSHIILTNLSRAADLISSFKQVAVDQSSDQRRTVQFKEYLDEIILSLRPSLKRSGHMIQVSCPADLTVQTFPGALAQIVTNLVMNSLAHAFEDRADGGTMRIEIQEQKGMLSLRYSDDGKGIEPEYMTKIFEPFYTTKRGRGGSGLGMSIIYNLVTQKLRGQIACTSEPGRGFQCDIRFPITEEAHRSKPDR
jgi:PAS domain S-box-containing protein